LTLPESSSTGVQKNLPFGAMPGAGDVGPKEGGKRRRSRRGGRRRRRKKGGEGGPDEVAGGPGAEDQGDDQGEEYQDGDDDEGDDEREPAAGDHGRDTGQAARPAVAPRPQAPRNEAPRNEAPRNEAPRNSASRVAPRPAGAQDRDERPGRRRRRKGGGEQGAQHGAPHGARETDEGASDAEFGATPERPERAHDEGSSEGSENEGTFKYDGEEEELAELSNSRDTRANKPLPREAGGMFVVDKGGIGVLRLDDYQWLPSKWDIYVPKRLVQVFKLRDGMYVHGRVSKGFKHKLQLDDVLTIDGKDPKYWKNKLAFQSLTSIDPDFHYAIGDVTDEVAMRVVDLLAPIGRGQRALLVAPPRAGKTTLLRQFAAGIEQGYPDVHLIVLLIDERPEEATEWQRSVTRGKVYASTADESAKHHIELAEAVWKRACRMVEAGDDVVLLLDSITRLARAYNNQAASGRTMSGGLDSRAMERPRKIFGSARNTVEAGSLTIIGTCLVDTGSRMDQMVFEEFKGTGNSEIVLSRRLADRRIFPAIDVEKSGTRKEEKLVGTKRLKQIHTLRRVLARMHFAEAMDLLVTRLGEAAKTADFLERFSVDPEA
jgi:transcription termination factor Rho